MLDRLRAWLGGGRPSAAAPECHPGTSVSCEEALASVYEYLDGEMESLTPGQVEEHFRVCAACYPHLLCEKAFREALQRAGRGARCPENVRRRILEALEGE